MITRIVWLVSLLCAVSAAHEREVPLQEFVFNAIVQDSGTFLGAKCDYAKEKCAAFERKLCQFIGKPLLPLEGPPDFCKMLSHSDRTKDNTITVRMKLTLYDDAAGGGLIISMHNPNFVGALNQALIYLYNTPDASVMITSIVPPVVPPVTAPVVTSKTGVLHVKGTLYWEQQKKNYSEIEAEKKCDLEKQLFNLDMGGDLLNMMYKYTKKHIELLPFDKESPEQVVFEIYYPNDFIEESVLIDMNDLAEKIQWGFRNPISKKRFYLGPDTVVTVKQSDDSQYEAAETIPFVFTAFVEDYGKLNGEKCDGPHQKCTEYKQRLCQLAQKPLFCGRVPTDWDTCSVNILNEREPDGRLKANISLRVQKVAQDMYPITYAPVDSCPTFAGMYKLAFASRSKNPTLGVIEFTPPLKPVALKTEKVEIQIEGTLLHKSKPVQSFEWDGSAEEQVKVDLLALPLREPMLQTFYESSSRKFEEIKFHKNAGGNVYVSMTVSYPKAFFKANAIDPGCDLNDMLQWGLRSTKRSKGYSFGSDIVVKNSVTETSTSFTFRATVKDNGNFQGAQCSGTTEPCEQYKVNLCAFVRKAFTSSQIASEEVCSIEILSNRTRNELKVRISVQLNVHASKLPFDVNCPTFGWLLNTAFRELYNNPETSLVITDIETPQLPPILPPGLDGSPWYIVYQVTGSLYRNGKPVHPTESPNIDDCEVNKQLGNLDMGADLLNVMYKYNKFNIYFRRAEPVSKEDQRAVRVSFKLHYKEQFFKDNNLNPNCGFADKLQWGFRHSAPQDQFHMGEDAIVERIPDANPVPGTATWIENMDYKVTINDGGKLNGIGCEPNKESCKEYQSQLCQLMEKPLLCKRVPIQPRTCEITSLKRSENGGSMTAVMILRVQEGRDQPDIPPILPSYRYCTTFSALHNLAFKTFYNGPIADLGIKSIPQYTIDKIVDPVVFTFTGLLKKHGKPATSLPDESKFFIQLANLELPGQLLQAIYKNSYGRTFRPVKPGQGKPFDGSVEFQLEYPKSYLLDNGIDPTCDLAEMLKWGFERSTTLDGYQLESVNFNHTSVTKP